MIVCPTHLARLESENQQLFCPICNYVASKKVDGSIYFEPSFEKSPDYDAAGLEILYKAEQNHFWFSNRINVIRSVFKKYIPKDKYIIEIGAGTGSVARALIKEGYRVATGELYPQGLHYAKKYGITERYQFNIYHTPFKEHFDVCCMFDVIEHLDDDCQALKNVGLMLKEKGFLVLTVPAHSWLWNTDDVVSGHKRRYEPRELTNLVENAGFDVVECKNFFLSILPLLYLRKLLKRDTKQPEEEKKLEPIEINFFINIILDGITQIENILCRNLRPTVGGSIILIARKKG